MPIATRYAERVTVFVAQLQADGIATRRIEFQDQGEADAAAELFLLSFPDGEADVWPVVKYRTV